MRPAQITTCEEAIRVLAEHLDHELAEPLDAQLRAHLDACRTCCSRAEFESALKDRLRESGGEEVPREALERFQSILEGFADSATP